VSKNYEILTTDSKHLEVGLYQILAPNSKVWNTKHVWYLRAVLGKNWFNTQNSIKSTQNDLKLCREDHHRRQIQSMGNQEITIKPSFSTLELDSPRSMNSWGFRWIPLVEGIYESKRSQSDESNQERKGEK
jgi:hypothetical protein